MRNILKILIIQIITLEARLVLRKYKPKIIAVTGNVGKTSTKDAIYSAISSQIRARKSEKSFNSEIGIPLTILGRPNAWANPYSWLINIFFGLKIIILKEKYPATLILEVGADKPGDIARVSKWLKPDIVVVTKFGEVPVHIEYFESRQELINEKSMLVKFMRDGGLLILCADDEESVAMRLCTKNNSETYGINEKADFTASNIIITYNEQLDKRNLPSGLSFKVNFEGNSIPLNIQGVLGISHVYSALAAICVSVYLKLDILESAKSLELSKKAPGRMRLIDGKENTLIIDDSYNSSPLALNQAIKSLKEIKSRSRKIAVLGDMMELGQYSSREHRKAGEMASRCATLIITVGIRSRQIAEAAKESKFPSDKIFEFDGSEEAAEYLSNNLRKGDVILIKGSQSIRMEKVVKKLMEKSNQAKNLLVRQEEEWQRR